MNELAKIIDEDKLATFAKYDELLTFLNQSPPDSLVRPHPLQKGVRYIPIDKIELMLSKVFQHWRVEILREGQLLNSVYVAVRLHYVDPLTNEWVSQDGVGAVQIQVDKGESASNLAAIKPNAIMLGLPAAKSFAVKDAAEQIGRIFGKDLNRRDTAVFTPSYDTEDTKKRLQAKIAETTQGGKDADSKA